MSDDGKQYTVRVTKGRFEIIREAEGPLDLSELAPHLVAWGEDPNEYLSEGKINGYPVGL